MLKIVGFCTSFPVYVVRLNYFDWIVFFDEKEVTCREVHGIIFCGWIRRIDSCTDFFSCVILRLSESNTGKIDF